MIIYKATNIINGKIYIGQTVQKLHKRKSQHKYKSIKANTYFANAIKKHGINNFKWVVIDKASTIEELNCKEIYWVSFYKSNKTDKGYNIKLGGDNHSTSELTKRKLSELKKGKPVSNATILKLKEWRIKNKTRKPMSNETKLKISIANKGKKRTQQTKALIKNIRTGTKASKESSIKKSLSIRGEKHYNCKINEFQALEILKRLKNGERQSLIAKEYKVTDGAIYRLKKGLSWKHLDRSKT